MVDVSVTEAVTEAAPLKNRKTSNAGCGMLNSKKLKPRQRQPAICELLCTRPFAQLLHYASSQV